MVSSLVKQTEFYIRENGLLDLDSGFRVVTGISGGADSVCLLLILYELARKYNGQVMAVHVHHGLRGEAADADLHFVEDLCKKMQIPLSVFYEDVQSYAEREHCTVEEAGRILRYQRFAETAEKAEAAIATAHHLDDNAETILFHLIRGADLKGVSGMQPETELNGYRVIRPLLFAERAEIEAYLEEVGQSYCTDATNFETDYTRNRIRHLILKEMKKLNPQAASHICETAARVGQAEELLAQQTENLFAETCRDTRDGGLEINANRLKAETPLIAERVLYKALADLSGGVKDLSRVHVKDLYRLLFLETGKQIDLPSGILGMKVNETLVLGKKDMLVQSDEPWQMQLSLDETALNGKVLKLPDGSSLFFEICEVNEAEKADFIEKNLYTKVFDYDMILGSLFIGNRSAGDLIALGNGTKTVNRYMIDEKIPRTERDRIYLLKDEKETMWIIGHRIGETHKITKGTAKVLKVTLEP